MTISIVTNRDVTEGVSDETLFGDAFNENGPTELRVAKAERSNAGWRLELLAQPAALTPENAPSFTLFDEVRTSLISRSRDCVFFVHALNQTLATNLKKCVELQDTYGVDVIAFSWPSEPGGQGFGEYEKARAAARLSATALERALHLLSRYLSRYLLEDCGVSLNLLASGTAVFMLEQLAQSRVFGAPARVFDNIILHQGDVDHEGHGAWVDRLGLGRRTYVTLNENDHVLKWSDLNSRPGRLGNTCRGESQRTAYIDFTHADLVESAHRIYWKSRHNPNVRAFFKRALHGARAERGEGVNFNRERNLFEVS